MFIFHPAECRRSRQQVANSRLKCRFVFIWYGVFFGCVVAWLSEVAAQQITVQQPVFGVSLDADGLLKHQRFAAVGGAEAMERVAAARQRQGQPVAKFAKWRKVSLRRLEAQLAALDSARLPEELCCLAGLKRIEAVFLMVEDHDIVVAGPAANWMIDLAGQARAVDDGHPTLQLEDLLTALQCFAPGGPANPWVACSIDPTEAGLRAYTDFVRQIPAQVTVAQQAELARTAPQELANRLGLANVRVWGIPAESRMALIMIEADYRMKMMAVDLEPAPPKITTFCEAIDSPISGAQRWWLTPNYEILTQSADAKSLRISGPGIQLNTEDVVVFPAGQQPAVPPAAAPRAARQYAASFTKHYVTLAQQKTVFAQLQTVVDLLVMAAWLNKVNAWEQMDWNGGRLFDPSYRCGPKRVAAKQVPCVANAIWKNRLLVFPVGGGVSISPTSALEPGVLRTDSNQQLELLTGEVKLPTDESIWWWD
ncbi:MAG: DUF1598 domain-containing protein [Planctomycetaceae bacterium]|nr:DUF1598 domain-containing protein [Planctomycetaceae bacterium]